MFNAISPQPLYSFAAGSAHVFSQNLVNYFNPAFSWYESLFGPSDFQKTLAAFPIALQGSGANAPFTKAGVKSIEHAFIGDSAGFLRRTDIFRAVAENLTNGLDLKIRKLRRFPIIETVISST